MTFYFAIWPSPRTFRHEFNTYDTYVYKWE